MTTPGIRQIGIDQQSPRHRGFAATLAPSADVQDQIGFAARPGVGTFSADL